MERPGARRPTFSAFVLATLSALGLVFPIGAADAPPQFGDFFSSATFTYYPDVCCCDTLYTADFPVFGRVKVAHSNSPVPADRVFFNYNYYQNFLNASSEDVLSPGNVIDREQFSVSKYTFGVEKMLVDERISVELRVPMFTQTTASIDDVDAIGGSLGNLAVLSKFAVFNGQKFTVTAGFGFSLPTGNDTRFDLPLETVTLENQAVHVQPYLAFLTTPTERSFYQCFLQVDMPLGANGIELKHSQIPLINDRVTHQAVLFLDFSAGYWLYRNRQPRFLTGRAPMVELNSAGYRPYRDRQPPFFTGLAHLIELHYTTSPEDAHTVRSGGGCGPAVEFGNRRQQFDMLNLTFGFHFEFRERTQLRVAAAFPVTSRDDNFFASEFLASIIHAF